MSELPLVFVHPEFGMMMWVWAAVVFGLVWFERRGSDALDRLVSGALQGRLVIRPSRWRRWARIALLGISGFAMIAALMQPQWGLRYVSTPRVGAEIMIALDVSRSMLADDAKPSRLERAKAEISDLLSYLDDDYVGLIAFAGRATVLSPMTPDKSFLRLALESAGPHSVTRGGTSLAEPIQRAVAGMGEAGPSQRALILITDGEDHDSFALDAAKLAAEAGIKIITIGFGDEAGSPIYLRDAKTGARTLLRDGDGREVISRLDGDLLREIALTTDGAFVPAGTGVLDLASIYEAHIADLTRGQLDERGRTIRDEAYQFFVLLALVCLIAAVSTSAGSRTAATRVALSLLSCFFLLLPSSTAEAQQDLNSLAEAGATIEPLAPLAEDERPGTVDHAEDPRKKFNRANDMLATGDAIAAAALLRDSRRDATDDAELRYAATYNLGLAAIAKADSLQASDASGALDSLYVATDWFREAAALRPEESDPRHNLDVTLRRALILADEIARTDQQELEVELDDMIDTQRKHVMRVSALLEEIVRSGELDAAEVLRPAFRDSATAQRIVLSDANALAERVARERQILASKLEAERSPEDILRSGQLEAVLGYLDSAIDRMGQTRRQLRQRRAERAYRRGSNALAELKRARDQLRDPVEQIGILLAEVGRLARSTGALASAGLAADQALPAFLTRESAEADSTQIQTRVEELAARFGMAAEQALSATANAGPSSRSSDPTAQTSGEEAEQEAQRIALIEAAPWVDAAALAMADVSRVIAAADYPAALEAEVEAGEALIEAQERFFALRQLLNTTFEDENRLAKISRPVEAEADAEDEGELLQARDEFVPALVVLQEKNLARALRLEDLLDREERTRISEIEASDPAGPPPSQEEGAATPLQLEGQRFDLARQRLALASGAMMEVTDAFPPVSDGTPANWSAVHEAALRASAHLDAIRTLFFSIAEHVRKLALDQVDVRDRTQEAIALSISDAPAPAASIQQDPSAEKAAIARGPETLARTNALADDQEGLEHRAKEIADALVIQAEEMAQAPAEGAGPEAQAEGMRIRKAAEFVASAGLAMKDAFDSLETEAAPMLPAPEAQGLAISDLQEALALLSPPPPEESKSEEEDSGEDDSSGEGESDSQQNEGAESSGDSEDASQQGAEEEMDDPSQLLQGVRDREAARRRDREREARRRRSVPVEKDW